MLKQILIAFIVGSLVTGATLGSIGYLQINTLNTENAALQQKLKKQSSHQKNLSKTQASLKEELTWLKEKKAKDYEQTIGALMQAKENAGIESLYEIGVKALREKDYPQAYYALSQVDSANPSYKEIAKFYPESKKAYDIYQQKGQQDKLKDTYAQAYDYQIKGQFAQAQTHYQRVLDLNPAYKDANKRLRTVSLYLNTRQKSSEFEQKRQWLEATYKLGISQQNLGRYLQAKDAYESIWGYAPQYKDTAKRLKAVKARLPKTQLVTAATSSQSASCYQKGLLFGKCMGLNADKTACAQVDLQHLPLECKDNPEFTNGMKSAVTVSTDNNSNEVSAADFFKGLPGLLNGL